MLTHPCTHTPCLVRSVSDAGGLFQNEWGLWAWDENFGEESPHPRCLCTNQTRLPISTSPPWFPGGKHPSTPYPSQITTWSISGRHNSVGSWQWGCISRPQLSANWLWKKPSDAALEPFLAAGYDCWIFRPKKVTKGQPAFNAGSITVIVVPLTSIGDQLKLECSRLGLSAVVGGQVVWSSNQVVSNIYH